MRSNHINFFFFLLFLFYTPLQASEESSALPYLNTIRQNSGLIPLRSKTELQKAATAHAKYLISNQTVGHLEEKGSQNFTGKTPTERVLYYGYPSKDVMENISVNAKNDTASIDDLFAAIYHRFVFLNFDKDEIGMGKASTAKYKKIKRAYVYNLGSSKLRSLCKKSFVPVGGIEYIQNVCIKSDLLIPRRLYEKNRTQIKLKNPAVVLHPYQGQEEVGTVFYNETPDPLPDYKVSGYPVSIQFNDAYVSKVTLKAFHLFDEQGQKIHMSRLLTHESDPHQKLKKTEFALMPMKRLEYGMTYRAEFEALVDGERYKKSWKFTTKGFEEKIYRITQTKTVVDLKENDTVILYFVPGAPNDILRWYKASEGLEISLIDQNTMRVRLYKKLSRSLRVEVEGRVVEFR